MVELGLTGRSLGGVLAPSARILFSLVADAYEHIYELFLVVTYIGPIFIFMIGVDLKQMPRLTKTSKPSSPRSPRKSRAASHYVQTRKALRTPVASSTNQLLQLVSTFRRHTPGTQARLNKWMQTVYPNVDYRIAFKYNYLAWIFAQRAQSFGVSTKPKQSLRLATYNVHYFTDVFEQINTYKGVLNDIKTIQADFMGLTEVLVGGKVRINANVTLPLENVYDDLTKCGYPKKTICNSVPSWYDGIYGNMLLVHKDVQCHDSLCTNLNESIFTFPKSTSTVTVSGGHHGTTETRCYIKVQYVHTGKHDKPYHIYVYTTHLDVASERERVKQVEHIIRDSHQHTKSNDVVFVMGDFNTVCAKDMDSKEKRSVSHAQQWRSNKYLGAEMPTSAFARILSVVFRQMHRVTDTFQAKGFYDCHAQNAATMTAWNLNRVDFIFCNRRVKQANTLIPEYAYTANSDHIPVVLTITKDVEFV